MASPQANADDVRDNPVYTISATARHLGMSSATLRHWVVGRSYSRRRRSAAAEPLIRATATSGLISFNNLVEAHVLLAFRSRDLSRMAAVGRAIASAEAALGVERLLLRPELCGSGQDVLFDRVAQLLKLSRSVELAMRHTLTASLNRLDRDDDGLPVRLYPLMPLGSADRRGIVIDPYVALGRPTVAGSDIETASLAGRIDSGADLQAVADDCGLDVAQVMDAVVYERVV